VELPYIGHVVLFGGDVPTQIGRDFLTNPNVFPDTNGITGMSLTFSPPWPTNAASLPPDGTQSTNAWVENDFGVSGIWYRITAAAGETCRLKMGGGAAFTLSIVDTNASILLQSTTPVTEWVCPQDGDYYVWLIGDSAGTFSIRFQPPATWNDYDGDGFSDRAVYDPAAGNWYIWSDAKQQALAWQSNWGYGGSEPVTGDYDGDGAADLAVFDSSAGRWYVRRLDGQVIALATNWGFPGAIPVPGDYDGDNVCDLAVFDPATGNWYIRTLTGTPISWAMNWGYSGAIPVAGDYDGDGVSDLAVYDEAAGLWYIRRVSGELILFGRRWGASGLAPVPGDYDGDTVFDLGLYAPATGDWFIWSDINSQLLAWQFNWGFAGVDPVSGDYNGDGIFDLPVYDASKGNWHVLRFGNGPAAVIINGLNWGGNAFIPVGAAW
jgi:hypothetical protein